ncbi:SH3 domain-containing protein [Streptomyces sp. NWU339]|uniref:SH3 domain-containing protein n=1 Tax=Streptomyces sp. NWU339 TaxID=2185284 RepID=UPI000D67AFF3|nr:SH3 domain-containing protein [Streptomyces sp. NWU339]PWI11658.1 SH3 domain-containing protein [Streptomyces sp. NWU339]
MSVDHVGEAEGTSETESVSTAALRYYPVAPGVRLNVRSGPGTGYTIVRVLAEGAQVPIFCQTPGTTVTGPYGTSKIWDNIANGEYVSDAYVKTGSDGYVTSRCA